MQTFLRDVSAIMQDFEFGLGRYGGGPGGLRRLLGGLQGGALRCTETVIQHASIPLQHKAVQGGGGLTSPAGDTAAPQFST